MKSFMFIWVLILFTSSQLFSQNHTVYGKLTTFNRFPVKNVIVFAKKSEASAISDSMGMFFIVCQKKDVLKIKPESFQPVTRRVEPSTDTLVINLLFVDSESNRQVATGYGYIDEKDLTYAVSNLDHENTDFCNYPDIYTLMKGKLAGVTVSRGAVFMRGVNSLAGSSEALLVVDGMIVDDISWINPCHVASIDVLKDSMAAIYGSRGANGVVVIKTKTGAE